MKNVVITGSLGNISRPLAEKLIGLKHKVTVITSSNAKADEIISLGAKPAVGSVEDISFLTNTFRGADVVYTMVPPNMAAQNWKQYIAGIGKNYSEAIKAAGVKYVVNLSSIGAHLQEGCGPVSGLYFVEQELNTLEGVNVKHLRPAYFYTNFYNSLQMIKGMGIMGGNFGANTRMVLVHPRDIAEVASEEIDKCAFTGKSLRYIASDERTTSEIAKVLGEKINNTNLSWVDFKDEELYQGLLHAGLSGEIAANFVEMGTALRSGKMAEHYIDFRPQVFGKTKLEDFANEFAQAYNV